MNDDLEHELTLLVRFIRRTIDVFFKFILFLAIGVAIYSFLSGLCA